MTDRISFCRLCNGVIGVKNRRLVFSPAFLVGDELMEVLGYKPNNNDGLSSYICLGCFGSLTKMRTITQSIEIKLKQERRNLVLQLKSKVSCPSQNQLPLPMSDLSHSVEHQLMPATEDLVPTEAKSEVISFQSPLKSQRKRGFVKSSPTPKKIKKSKVTGALFTEKEVQECSILTVLRSSEKTPVSIYKKASKRLFSPGHMRVVETGEVDVRKTTSRVVKDKELKKLLKSIARGESSKCIAKQLFASHLRDSLKKQFLNELTLDCQKICSEAQNSMLRNITPMDMTTFNFDKFSLELQLYSPILNDTLNCLTSNNLVKKVSVGAFALFSRNNKMSLLQHIIGQVLEKSGTTDEAINAMNKLGVSVSTSSIHRQKQMIKEFKDNNIKEMFHPKDLEKSDEVISHDIEVIGDNVDITRNPSQMSKDRQRDSWHWFVLLGVKKRVLFPDLPDEHPQADILTVSNDTFLPSLMECEGLENNFIFHTMHVLVKYIPELKNFKSCLPKNISHQFEKETSKKSEFEILDLLNKSENKSAEMINILQHIHANYMPKNENSPKVGKRIVFGGDCLTNERAYAAQMAMLNHDSQEDRLGGVIHRPEGLHRMMNLCLFIYQQFYKKTSAKDAGTLYQLRNIISRVDVRGSEEVISKYRAHFSFIQDVLDGYIVAAAMEIFGVSEFTEETKIKLPPLVNINEKTKYTYLHKLAKEINDSFVKTTDYVKTLSDKVKAVEKEREEIVKLCAECGQNYKSQYWLRRHIKEKHGVADIETDMIDIDVVSEVRAAFMMTALLLRDSNDAYKFGDGDRIARNAKFEFLLADVGHHWKYKQWLFRFISYITATLTERESKEYIWNCTSNTAGGKGCNIPNDNLVEMNVHSIKKKVQSQGSNATFDSVRKAALCIITQNNICDNLMKESNSKPSGKKKGEVNKVNDIRAISNECLKGNLFMADSKRQLDSFKSFNNFFKRTDMQKLYKWLNDQKNKLKIET